MIRYALLFSILAAPLAAQTTLEERPGRWITVPRAAAPAVEAPAVAAPVMEAPASGPLITAEPAPRVVLTAPEADLEAVVLIAPPRSVPDTRPIPRPRALEVIEAPDIALEVVEVAAVTLPVLLEPTPEPAFEVAAIEAAPVQVIPAPETRPIPRPRTEETAALAEALAEQIVAEALAIVTAAPRALPLAEGLSSEATFVVPPRPVVTPQAAIPVSVRSPAPARPTAPPSAVPLLAAALGSVPASLEVTSMAAVLLPSYARTARPVVQPVAFIAPPLDSTPILPRLSPSGPQAQGQITGLAELRRATLSAVLMPSLAVQSTPIPQSERSRAPAYDAFPLSALPPSSLMAGPENMMRAIQPPRPFAEYNAAVLAGSPTVIPARLPVMPAPPAPEIDLPMEDPDAPSILPEPDAGALVRMMEDAMICWRLANLSVEAQWARLSVDVALDETNMPSAQSIRLTGFAHVISSAAEDAYRAAHSALMGCAEATTLEPATTSATLVFDRNGVRLQ